jgi:hypothetical protein
MAQDFLSQLFGGQPDYSQFMTPQQSGQAQSNALTSAGLNAAIALLGASGQTSRPVSTGQVLGSALSAGLGGYQSSFDNTLRQILAQGKLADMQQNRQLTEQTLAANRLKMEREKQYQDQLAKVFVPTPVQVPMSTGVGSQLEMLSRPEFGGDMALPETRQALQQNLPTAPQLDMNALIQALSLSGPEGLTKAATLLQPKEVKDTKSAKVKDFEYAVGQGYTGSFTDFIKSGVPSTNVSVSMDKGIATQIGPMLKDERIQAQGAAAQIDASQRVIQAVDTNKIIAGPTASAQLRLAQVGSVLGITGADTAETIANTRQAIRGFAELTLQGRKSMRGEGAITESEGKLAERAFSGDIDSLTPAEIKQLANASKRSAEFSLGEYNRKLEVLKKDPSTAQLVPFYEVTRMPAEPAKIKVYNPKTGKVE